MKIYKKLAGQTIIYGLGTIVPRILNFSILTIYYTRLFSVEQFGVITELYAYVTFLMIILTYGTETGYFRFASDDKKNIVFSSLTLSLLVTSVIFTLGIILFRQPVANAIQYSSNVEYISILAVIIGIDSFLTIPFAKLRREERSKKFAVLKILNVVITIAGVLFFYEFLPPIIEKTSLGIFIRLRQDVIYVLIANLIASAAILVLLIPEVIDGKFEFDKKLLSEILKFSLPLLIAGLAGTVNETLDRVLLKYLIPDKEVAIYTLGIYGANFRIAVLLFIFIQMFRYAVEPFYFNYYGKPDEKEVFAQIMRLYLGVAIVITMGIVFYIDYVKYFISPRFHEGLRIVPIVLLGYILYGVFFNQSMWYKFTKQTSFAIILTIIGAVITIFINVLFVKKYSYYASASAHVFSYATMIIISYFLSRKYYPISYNLYRIAEYVLVALAIFALKIYVISYMEDLFSALLIIIYTYYILRRENLVNKEKLKRWILKS